MQPLCAERQLFNRSARGAQSKRSNASSGSGTRVASSTRAASAWHFQTESKSGAGYMRAMIHNQQAGNICC